MRIKQLSSLLVVVAACNGGDGTTRDAAIDQFIPDAPESVPHLTSFVPSPMTVPANTPAAVTWNWTYLVDPPYPPPTCTISNGVGEVTRGQMTMVTLTEATSFRLTCANRAGMTARDAVVQIPVSPPTISTFTATPSSLTPGAATNVTFAWTYTTFPSPAPTCTIDGGVGAATSGTSVSLNLPQARTFRLRCTNTQGTSTRDVTVAVSECASAATNECGANATCTDTVDSYTCACNATYSGNGDVCSKTGLSCTTPGTCALNAQCIGGTTCVCDAGYVGDGLTCTRARLTFISSALGNGNLSTWTGAVGTGLAAADAFCNTLAANQGLPGTYVAWMSDSSNDAYCRVHGLPGKKSAMCGLGALPVAAGPWVRTDTLRQPTAPAIDKLLAPTRQTFYPASYTEAGSDVSSSTPVVWTGTDDTGVYSGAACGDWGDASSLVRGSQGHVLGGGTSWTDFGTDPTCSSAGRLRCVERDAGPALPARRSVGAKKAFLTSVVGTGVLSTWPDAQGLSGVSAADAICQARARYAGYANAASYRAWAAASFTYATSRISGGGPWYRPDGILIASSESDLIDARLGAPMYQTETGSYVSGNAETGGVWTGAMYSGYYYSSSFSYSCSVWGSSSGSAIYGRHDLSDFRWSNQGSTSTPVTTSCSTPDLHLYCLDDSF